MRMPAQVAGCDVKKEIANTLPQNAQSVSPCKGGRFGAQSKPLMPHHQSMRNKLYNEMLSRVLRLAVPRRATGPKHRL